MKKRIVCLFLTVLMVFSCVAVLASCGGDNTACTNHVDANHDGKCDTEGCSQTLTVVHKDNNGDGKCDTCGATVEVEECEHEDEDLDGYCDICDEEVEMDVCEHYDDNGDGWCDGMDAVLVSCIVNGMLSESDISELAYRAADCNHDGVIDEADVDLLNQAGALLAEVDQTKSAEVLLETSSAYVEYIELIDQSPEIDVEDETDAPEADVEPEDTTPEQNAKIDIFEMIISFIKSIFEMLLAFIPVPIK